MPQLRHLFLPLMVASYANFSSIVSATEVAKQAKPEANLKFEIQPYLFKNGGDSSWLAWRYEKAVSNSQVQIFAENKLKSTIPASDDGVVWFAKLPSLRCGENQHLSYLIKGMREKLAVPLIPCPGQAQSAQFSFLADAQEGPGFVKKLLSQKMTERSLAILCDGDLVQTGSNLKEWSEYFAALQPFASTKFLVSSLGNHEYRSTQKTNYWQNFFQLKAQEAYYSIELGEALLIVLNSNFTDENKISETQLPWLEKELQKNSRWKIVMFHHPPFSIGFFNSLLAPKKEYILLREKYVPLFEKYKVDLVLNGHTHIFERAAKNGVQYLIAGPAGGKMGLEGALNIYSIKSSHQRSITHIEVSAKNLGAKTYSVDGALLDELKLEK